MIKKITTTLFFCFLIYSSFSQWNQQTVGNNSFTSVYFTSATNGCAVNAAGGIYTTSNGGTNWSLQTTASSSMYSVFFGSATNGTAVGAGGTVMSTTDAGTTWTQNSSSQGYALSSVFFVDADTGYAVGNNGTIIKTINGGSLWQQRASGTINNLNGVFFTDVNTGYAIGSNVILKTTDRGNSWASQASAILTSVYFTNANTGYATGYNGLILKTIDAGLSWNTLTSGTSNALYSIRFADANTGYAVGDLGTILKTNDAGATWALQNSGTTNTLNSVFFTDSNNGYAVGISGTIINTTNGGCSTPAAPTASGQTICSGNTATLTATAPGGTYQWYDAPLTGTLLITATSYTTLALVATTTYYVQTTITGCISPRTAVTVTVNPAPTTPVPSSNSPVCSGTNLSLTASTIAGANYFWTGPNAYTSSAQNPTIFGVSAAASGSYSVTATVGGCTSSAGITSVIVNPLPIITSVSAATICSGGTVNIFLTSNPASSFTWVAANNANTTGESTTMQSTGTLNNTITNSTSVAQNITYTVTATSLSGGCTMAQGVTVTINPIPVATTTPSSQTICSGGNTSIVLTSNVAGTTFSWIVTPSNVTGATSGASPSINQTLSSPSSGTAIYSITPTVTGCAGSPTTVTITVNPNANITFTSAVGTDAQALCINTPLTNITYTISGGGTGAGITGLPPGITGSFAGGVFTISGTPTASGTFNYTVTTTGTCTQTTATGTITVNPTPPAPTALSPASYCQGNIIADLTATGTGGTLTWYSDAGLTIPVGTGSTFASGATSTSTFYVLETLNGCQSTATAVSIVINPSTGIYGHVSYSLGDVTSGKMIIYLENGLLFDSVQVATLDANGIFNSPPLNPGNYLLKAFADTSYHNLTPTYNGNVWDWNVATVIVHDCSMTDTANIAMVEVTALVSGPGSVGGIIQEGISFGRQEGDPIPGLDVKLGKNPGGSTNIVASTQTDADGYYYFDNLPLNSVVGGSYIVYADIPGLGMTASYDVILDPTNPTYDSLNYAVDSTSIYPTYSITVGISNPAIAKENKFKVFPNPFKGNASIEYNIFIEADVTLEVMNVLGVKIKSLVNSRQSAGNHKCSLSTQNNNLSSGVYFITLTIDEKPSTQRIVVME